MAVELVIKISEEIYDYIHNEHIALRVCDSHQVAKAIANGTPLPKGHGRLGDLDALREEVSSWGMNDYEPLDFIDVIDEADAIIEADRGEVESRESEDYQMATLYPSESEEV